MVHQHFMLVPVFTVAENIILGAETVKGLALDLNSARRQIRDLSRVDVVEKNVGFVSFEAAYEGIFQPTAEWTWPVQSQCRHDVIFAMCMDLTQCRAHARAFDLKTTDRFTLLNAPGCCRIIGRRGI